VTDPNERMAAFRRFAHRSVDVAALVERAVEVSLEMVDLPIGAMIRIVGRRPARLVVVHASGGVDARLGQAYDIDSELATTLRGSEPIVVPDCAADRRFTVAPLPGSSPAAFVGAPITVDGYPWGQLIVADRAERGFTPEEVDVVCRVADLTAAAIERSRQERARIAGATLSAFPPSAPGSATEVAVLDRTGVIMWVNQAWLDFARDNGGDPARTGVGMSYLECCDASPDPTADEVADAIRTAVRGELPAPMHVRIPCHSPTRPRWYDVLVSSRVDGSGRCQGATVTLSPARSGPS